MHSECLQNTGQTVADGTTCEPFRRRPLTTGRATCEGEPQLLAAIYHGVAFGRWNRMRDLLDDMPTEDELEAANAAERGEG